MTLKRRIHEDDEGEPNESVQTQTPPPSKEDKQKSRAVSKESLQNYSPLTRQFFQFSTAEWKWSLYISLVALVVRFMFIHHPSVVVSEEAVNGEQAMKYQNGEFYLDANPPLGKMLFYLVSWFNGGISYEFPFGTAGASYAGKEVPYISMRLLSATFGAMTVPLMYLLSKKIGVQDDFVAGTVSMIALFDNALSSSFRLIMLDGIACCFSLTGILLCKMAKREGRFSMPWCLYLCACFASLTCAFTTKFSALSSAIFVAFELLSDSWSIFKDSAQKVTILFKDLIAKLLLLTSTAFIIYVIVFLLHASLLPNEGDKPVDLMSPRFRAALQNSVLPAPTPEILHYGARIVLKHYQDSNFYLHSHAQLYPIGSKQQQVTGYSFHDINNIFIIRKGMAQDPPLMERETVELGKKRVKKERQPNESAVLSEDEYEEVEEKISKKERYYDPPRVDESTYLEPVRSGDVVRLEHELTGRFLHSHFIEPPSQNKDQYLEVSCYGGLKHFYGDSNDNWIIENVDDKGNLVGKPNDPIKCQTLFARFTHENMRCALLSTRKTLPDWGHFQREIACGRDAKPRNTAWIIVANDHPLYPDASEDITYGALKPKGLLEKFAEINSKMRKNARELVKFPQTGLSLFQLFFASKGTGIWKASDKANDAALSTAKENDIASKLSGEQSPSVPSNQAAASGTKKARDDSGNAQIFMIGNLFSWPLASVCVFSFVALSFARFICCPRELFEKFFQYFGPLLQSNGSFVLLGWMLHALPSVSEKQGMQEYFMAHFFSIQMLGIFLQFACIKFPKAKYTILASTLVAVVAIYAYLSPITYGFSMNAGRCRQLKMFNRNWDIHCEEGAE